MSEYTFISEITQAVLPFGITKSTQVTREEATIYLAKIKQVAPKQFASWGDMFVKNRVGLSSWDAKTVQIRINQLGSDIDCLVSLLYVTPTVQEQPDDNR